MKQKIVLTRNFKNHTRAKYCAAVFGQPPESAVELDEIDLENAAVAGTHQNNETRDFDDFGCGTLIIGEGQLPEFVDGAVPAAVRELPPIPKGRKIKWGGAYFKYDDEEGGVFEKAKRLIASRNQLLTA
jgi:hypothetical protein